MEKMKSCSLKVSNNNWQKMAAIAALNQLDVCQDFVDMFTDKGWPCYYITTSLGSIGYWAFQDKELQAKIDEFEEKTGALVYGITVSNYEFGECYAFLYIPAFQGEYMPLEKYNDPKLCNAYIAASYVWNKTADMCSEYGDVVICGFGGGIRRIY